MKCVVELTEVEGLTLQQFSINLPHQGMRILAAGLPMLANGNNRKMVVAGKPGVSGQSVDHWAHVWRQRGVVGLLVRLGRKDGRPPALSSEMVATPVRIASAESQTWTQVGQPFGAEFGTLPFDHLDTLSEAVKCEGFTFNRNRYVLKKDVASFMMQVMLAKLQYAARKSAIYLLYFDDVGIGESPPVQWGWLPPGLPHQVEPNTHCRLRDGFKKAPWGC